MTKFDVAIVGAGIAGASLAATLTTQSKLRILLLDMESQPGRHATGRSAALFSETYGGAVIQRLTRESRAFFETPPDGFTEYELLHRRGLLHVASTEQTAELERRAAAIRTLDPSCAFHDGAFARRIVPVLREEAVAACLWEPDAADIDVHGLLTGYLRQARQAGVTLVTDATLRGATRMADGWKLDTAGGAFECALLVDAAGAWADAVASLAGLLPLGLTPMRRTAMLVDPPPGADIDAWPFTIAADETVYFKPDAGKLLLSPADETPSQPCDAVADEMDVAIAVDRAEQLADLKIRNVRQRWAGLRTFATDRVPVVGFDRDPGFFWLAGQGGYGVQTAPALADLGARMIAHGASAPTELDPLRFR